MTAVLPPPRRGWLLKPSSRPWPAFHPYPVACLLRFSRPPVRGGLPSAAGGGRLRSNMCSLWSGDGTTRPLGGSDQIRWRLADDDGGRPDLLGDAERVPGRDELAGLELLHVRAQRVINRVPEASGLPFRWTVNPYRGCSHACVYCFARPTHEYLGFGIGEDFDRRIVVKVNAVERLRAELRSVRWRGETIAMGTNTDPYQPVEGRYRLTQGIVETLASAQQPVLDPHQVDADPARHRPAGGGDAPHTRWSTRRCRSAASTTTSGARSSRTRPTRCGAWRPCARLNEAGVPCGVHDRAGAARHLRRARAARGRGARGRSRPAPRSITPIMLHLRRGVRDALPRAGSPSDTPSCSISCATATARPTGPADARRDLSGLVPAPGRPPRRPAHALAVALRLPPGAPGALALPPDDAGRSPLAAVAVVAAGGAHPRRREVAWASRDAPGRARGAASRSSPGPGSQPIRPQRVGATSPRLPPSRRGSPGRSIQSGTGLLVCAVFLEPSGSIMYSLLPWSAVTQSRPAGRRHGRAHRAHAGVDRLDAAHGGLDHAGVAHHVGVGEVDDDQLVGPLGERLDHGVADARRAHLGGEVVGGDVLRRGHQHAPLARRTAPRGRR